MMDTAMNAGPRSVVGGVADSLPHAVPEVPAPKFSTGGGVEGEAEEEATARASADEVPEGVSLVVSEGPVDMDDEAEEVEEAETSDAEDRTLGQNVLLHVCISIVKHC